MEKESEPNLPVEIKQFIEIPKDIDPYDQTLSIEKEWGFLDRVGIEFRYNGKIDSLPSQSYWLFDKDKNSTGFGTRISYREKNNENIARIYSDAKSKITDPEKTSLISTFNIYNSSEDFRPHPSFYSGESSGLIRFNSNREISVCEPEKPQYIGKRGVERKAWLKENEHGFYIYSIAYPATYKPNSANPVNLLIELRQIEPANISKDENFNITLPKSEIISFFSIEKIPVIYEKQNDIYICRGININEFQEELVKNIIDKIKLKTEINESSEHIIRNLIEKILANYRPKE